jgi:tRNA A-37 threonylcarbamoyl transferase component Bud32/membrane-associated phospholipid phosphatase
MESTPRPALPGVDDRGRLLRAGTRGIRRRRRPSGEPPPLPRPIQITGVQWLLAAVTLVALAIAAFSADPYGLGVAVSMSDTRALRWIGERRTPSLTSVMQVLSGSGLIWGIQLLRWSTLLGLLVLKRLRHLLVLLGASLTVAASVSLLAWVLHRPRPFGIVIIASWSGWAMPSRPVAYLAAALVGVLYTLVPQGRWRQAGKWIATGLVALAAIARMYVGVDGPADVLVGAVLGTTIPLLAFRLFTPNEVFPVTYRRGRAAHLDISGRRGQAIRRAVQEQLGVVVLEVEPFGQQWSASSTPLRLRVKGDPHDTYLFAKLYAIGHLRADRWYKLARSLLYGRLEDEKAFNTVRRLVEHEDYALRLLRDSGVPVPKPLGSVELTPEREYLLVTEFLQDAKELSEVQVDDAIIDEGLAIVRRLWDAGLAHRDIKPANLLVQDGHVRLIDTFLTEVHPSPWRQAVDLANMLLVLALLSDPARVYQRARQMFTERDIGEAFAARQGRAMPSQVRQMLLGRRPDLREEFLRLLPERPHPIAIQRWSVRRVGRILLVVVGSWIAVTVFIFNMAPLQNSEINSTAIGGDSLSCEGGPRQAAGRLAMAQSVPSASKLPCLKLLPVGWAWRGANSRNGASWFSLDSDRVGIHAVTVRLTSSCDIRHTTRVPSDHPGTRRYQEVIDIQPGRRYQAVVYYQFPGGCVTYQLDFRGDEGSRPLGEVSLALGFTDRETLRETLLRASHGRLELDPPHH